MNPKFVKHLIAQGESATVEFKEVVDLSTAEGKAEFCKDLMSLANIMRTIGKTSYLLIGVSDNGEIKGMKAPLTHRQIKDAADYYCQPPVIFRYWQGIVDGKVVGVIIIPQSYRKPHKFKREFSSEKKRFAENAVYTRHLSHVVLASPEEIVALDHEAAQLRRHRLMLLLSIAIIAFLALFVAAITSGVAYARPIQEFATLFFPQGIPLLPSGFDPRAMPLVESQIDRAVFVLTKFPFKAEYASRVIAKEGEFVSLFVFEHADPKNYKVTIKANYGYLVGYGGETTVAVKDGNFYHPDYEKPGLGFKSPLLPQPPQTPFDFFEYEGIRAPLHLGWEDCYFSSIGRAEYRAWAKMVRLHGRLVRIYERSKVPTNGFCLLSVGSLPELKGIVHEKAYIDLETGALLKYEAKGEFQTPEGESALSYEIGFEVNSFGAKFDIDWSFLD